MDPTVLEKRGVSVANCRNLSHPYSYECLVYKKPPNYQRRWPVREGKKPKTAAVTSGKPVQLGQTPNPVRIISEPEPVKPTPERDVRDEIRDEMRQSQMRKKEQLRPEPAPPVDDISAALDAGKYLPNRRKGP